MPEIRHAAIIMLFLALEGHYHVIIFLDRDRLYIFIELTDLFSFEMSFHCIET